MPMRFFFFSSSSSSFSIAVATIGLLLAFSGLPAIRPFVLSTGTRAARNRWSLPSRAIGSMARTASARGATRQSSTEPLQNESNGEDTSRGFPLSNKVLGTLDPCVVKTKQWMEDHAHRWEDKEGIFSLAQGVVYWSPPPACRKALVDAVMPMAMASGGESNADGNADDPLALHSYSPAGGLPELVEALKAKIGAEHGMTDHDVTVTVGANQAYTNIVLTLLGDNGGRAVVFCPYYFNHVMAIQMCAGPEAVVTGPTDMSTGRPDLEWLGEALRSDGGIRLVTLVNPGNPTGVALPEEDLREIVDLCRDHGVWLVLDCTYEHFFYAPDGSRKASRSSHPKYETNPLPTFPNDPHVIHVFSFSKGYALAGYRCGYVVTHRGDASEGSGFLEQMLKVQDTIPIGPPRLSQHVALGALRQGADQDSGENAGQSLYSPGSKEWVYEKYDTLDPSRQCILEALSSLPQTIGGSGSMYVMGRLPDHLSRSSLPGGDDDDDDLHDDGAEPIDVLVCKRLVRDYGIAVIPGSFGGTPGWIRVCYANLPPDRTRLAAERLRNGIEELTGGTAAASR